MINWAVLETNVDGETVRMFRRTDENGKVYWVPEAPGNRHYQQFLEWVAEGNTPEEVTE